MEYNNFVKTEKIPGYDELLESMENVAQESTLEQGISDIREDISHIDIDTSDLAKETTAQAAKDAADDAKAAAQALAPVAQAAEAYAEGKPALAQAITRKGVQTESTDSLAQMATNVMQISQDTIVIDGGEMYAKQLYGSLTTPNYWNLYEVLAGLLSDGRFVNYGGILLAEYDKTGTDIALSQAGAGGGYVTSDGAYYTADVVHTWNDDLDGKGNRWVAYLFASTGHGFTISNYDSSPLSIFIGRSVGTIECASNTKISEIVVPDGNELDGILSNGYNMNWTSKIVLRNGGNCYNTLIKNITNIQSIYLDIDKLENGSIFGESSGSNLMSIILKVKQVENSSIFKEKFNHNLSHLSYVVVSGIESCTGYFGIEQYQSYGYTRCPNLKEIIFPDIEELHFMYYIDSDITDYVNIYKFYFGYNTNDKTKSVNIYPIPNSISKKITDIELQNGWCKNFDIITSAYAQDAYSLTESNIYSHILQKLKQDEANCGDGITITLGSTNLAKLTSAESVALLDSLTNTYGYTFA